MEAKPIFEIKRARLGTRQHDGVEVWPDRVVVKQRTRGGEQIVPYSAITEVGTARSRGEVFCRTLRIRTSHHTYVVRHLTKQEAEEATHYITTRMSEGSQ
jgi:hypothetical protein